MCWHKYPKEWADSGAVYRLTAIPAKQWKRCGKCNKVKWRWS